MTSRVESETGNLRVEVDEQGDAQLAYPGQAPMSLVSSFAVVQNGYSTNYYEREVKTIE